MAETTDERRNELESAAIQAYRAHFKTTDRIVPGHASVDIDTDVRLEAFHAILQKGVYFVADGDKAATLLTIDAAGTVAGVDAEEKRMEEAGLLERVELEDGGVAMRPTPGNEGVPVQCTIRLIPVTVPGRDVPVTLLEAASWCAINEADDAGDHDRAQRLWRTGYGMPDDDDAKKRTRTRPARTAQEIPAQPKMHALIPDKTAQELMGQNSKSVWTGLSYDSKPRVIATNTTGSSISVALTPNYLAPGMADAIQESIERAASFMTADDEFWHNRVVGLALENPHKRTLTDIDVLGAAGYKNPAQKGCDHTRADALRSIRKMNNITGYFDTTADAYERGAAGRTWEKTESAIIEGRTRVYGDEDGAGGWELILKPNEDGADAVAALPLAEIALRHGQIMLPDASWFMFPDELCGKVTYRHRVMLDYIYKHAYAKTEKHPEIVRFDTMFEKLGIEVNKNTISKTMAALERPLEWWQSIGVITDFKWRPAGRTYDALIVTAPRKELEKPKKRARADTKRRQS